ncbi:Polynucleotide 5'-hydroxyl-kinase grc3 [Vermiconidia calcicola]|uniref:Polynucleotide 5'-hydroxyl-kinase grc3 n=1 Tax=Vermiconidia calcicola TaxID=1690605 RepID=A0ACC3MLC2_9PEZI|nr:Polynucleotide 5'-hydroxyl-kinase grc3 [Vermiconidia calcicola]
MAQKRKAREAFGDSKGQLSAFAAAKLARQSAVTSSPVLSEVDVVPDRDGLATAVATEPYDGRHSRASTPAASPSNEEIAEVTVTPRKPAVTTRCSTWQPDQQNVSRDEDGCLELALQHDETATFIGEYDVEVLSGIVTIYGTVLQPNSGLQRVYAPSTHALPQIQARQPNTALRLSSATSGLRKLEKLSPLFRNIWASQSTSRRSFTFLATTDDDASHRSLNVLEIDRDADAVLRTLSAKTSVELRKPRIMAVGAKSSGKSTFNRVMCNHLYSWTQAKKCLYLDLDPGQPEFGPPGRLSLVEVAAPVLSPPFAHPASTRSRSFRMVRSHTIAATTFRDDSEHYKACALDLARYVDKQYPLIVNSCGWVSGLGAAMLTDLAHDLSISDIVVLEPLDSRLIEALRSPSSDLVLHRIPRRTPRPSFRTPAESRAMQMMAYFHHKPSPVDGNLRWSSKAISKMRPWVVSYAGPDPGVSAVASYGQGPNPEFLAEVLDGSIVAIVVLNEPKAQQRPPSPSATGEEKDPDNLANHIARTSESLPYLKPNNHGINLTVPPQTSRCLALALIRGIDTVRKQIHLVTPLPESEAAALMQQKVVLVRGVFDPPEWAYYEDLYKGDGSIDAGERPWISKKGMVGIEGAVWRLRHPPMAAAVGANR